MLCLPIYNVYNHSYVTGLKSSILLPRICTSTQSVGATKKFVQALWLIPPYRCADVSQENGNEWQEESTCTRRGETTKKEKISKFLPDWGKKAGSASRVPVTLVHSCIKRHNLILKPSWVIYDDTSSHSKDQHQHNIHSLKCFCRDQRLQRCVHWGCWMGEQMW